MCLAGLLARSGGFGLLVDRRQFEDQLSGLRIVEALAVDLDHSVAVLLEELEDPTVEVVALLRDIVLVQNVRNVEPAAPQLVHDAPVVDLAVGLHVVEQALDVLLEDLVLGAAFAHTGDEDRFAVLRIPDLDPDPIPAIHQLLVDVRRDDRGGAPRLQIVDQQVQRGRLLAQAEDPREELLRFLLLGAGDGDDGNFGHACSLAQPIRGIQGQGGAQARCIMEIERTEAMGAATEADIRRHATRLYEAAAATTPRLFDRKWWTGRLLEWAIRDEAFKVQLFRFIDVLPTLKTPSQIKRLVDEYFGQDAGQRDASGGRSEERRVEKECRSRWL